MRTTFTDILTHRNAKRLVSFCLALALLLTLLPALPLVEVRAEVASTGTVTVYFKDTEGWGRVYGYAWTANGQPCGSWPGERLPEVSGFSGYYALTLENIGENETLNVIFSNGNGSQTVDLRVSGAGEWFAVPNGSQDGKLTCTVGSASMPAVDGRTVTFSYTGTASAVKLAGTMNGWSGVAMTKNGSTFTYIATLEPGVYEYKFVVDGNWTSDPGNPFITGNDNNSVLVVTGPKNATISGSRGTTVTLPGEQLYVCEDTATEYRPVTYSMTATSGVTLSGRTLTISSGYAQDTVSLTATTADGETAPVTVSLTENSSTSGHRVTVHFVNNVGWGSVIAHIWREKGSNDGTIDGWSWPGQMLGPDEKGYYTLDLTYTYNSGEAFGFLLHNGSGSQTVDLTIPAADLSGGSAEVWVQPTQLTDGKYTCTVVKSESALVRSPQVEGNQVTFRYQGSAGQTIYVPGTMNGWSTSANPMTYENGVYTCTMTLSKGDYAYKFYNATTQTWFTDPLNFAYTSDGNNALSVTAETVAQNKVTSAYYNYSTGKLEVRTSAPITTGLCDAFSVYDSGGEHQNIQVIGVENRGDAYILRLNRRLDLGDLFRHRVSFNGTECAVYTENVFYTNQFHVDFTYNGDDLGANWTETATTFKVWAPTAEYVYVKIFWSGNYGANDLYREVELSKGDKGVWSVTVPGDLNGKYYVFNLSVEGNWRETQDPYAVSAGANGDRSMILDLGATNPAGWDQDTSPHAGMSCTDAIIYETHIRDFTVDESSGVSSANRGKFLGMVESGTTTSGGNTTGIDYLKELGITHLQLMPVYDFNSVDEWHLNDWDQYAWGYDPKNYNVPEGSYSSDPFNGSVRVSEMKQMVKTLHDNNISVVMDVCYNHAFDGGNFCFNKIVPNYFSRFGTDGSWSNGSGCGNDTATERDMVRNYIVQSILHWVEEYHIDGFRFDLVGLMDTRTINEIINTVHAKYPHVLFYGEGWELSTACEYGTTLANQGNAWQVGGLAFFNDTLRNDLSGDNGNSTGFASGAYGKEDGLADRFRGSNWWSSSPTQTINYVSCHDNYTLMDKLCISRDGAYYEELIRMNELCAAFYLTAQGVPFIHAGEEFLREKKDGNGNRVENSFMSGNYVNKINWSALDEGPKKAVSDYYKGLIELRKNHAALRMTDSSQIWNNVSYTKVTDQVMLFRLNGGGTNGEVADSIVIIFNASTAYQSVNLIDCNVPWGDWQAVVHGSQAGVTPLWSMNVGYDGGTVGVEPMSATVLIMGDLVDENSKYNQNCKHPDLDTDGTCTNCGERTAAITQKGRTLSYEDLIYVIDIFDLTGIEDIDLTKDAGLLIWSVEEFEALSEIAFDEDHANVGLSPYKETGYYAGASDGIFTRDLHEEAYYVGYVKLADGSYIYSEPKLYSPAIYAYNMLEKDTTSDATKELCVALLNYISAAQLYFDSTTPETELVNADLTDAQKALVWDNVALNQAPEVPADKQVDRDQEVFAGTGKNLLFEEMISIVSIFKIDDGVIADAQDCGTIFWTAEQFAALEGTPGIDNIGAGTKMPFTQYKGNAGQWCSHAPAVAAKDMADTQYYYLGYVVHADGSVSYSGVISYTVEQYISNTVSKESTSVEMLAFAQRLYHYERAAKAALKK